MSDQERLMKPKTKRLSEILDKPGTRFRIVQMVGTPLTPLRVELATLEVGKNKEVFEVGPRYMGTEPIVVDPETIVVVVN